MFVGPFGCSPKSTYTRCGAKTQPKKKFEGGDRSGYLFVWLFCRNIFSRVDELTKCRLWETETKKKKGEEVLTTLDFFPFLKPFFLQFPKEREREKKGEPDLRQRHTMVQDASKKHDRLCCVFFLKKKTQKHASCRHCNLRVLFFFFVKKKKNRKVEPVTFTQSRIGTDCLSSFFIFFHLTEKKKQKPSH